MNNLIQILHLEDDAMDAELIRAALESAGIVCQINRVQSRDDFTQALQQGDYDLILADYRLPTYDGVSALRLVQELRPDLPFIFVSGTLGEDAAIDGFTQGATDYVLKHRLARLASAVERARREADNQRLRQQAEAALHERVQQAQSLLRLSKQLERAQTHREIVNAALAEVRAIIGYQNLWVYLVSEDRESCTAQMADGQMSNSVMTGKGIATLVIKGDPLLEEITTTKEIVIVEDARTDDRTDKTIVARLGNRTIVNVPIILSNKHLGAVGTGTFGAEGVRVPTASEQEYLMTLASHLAVSLDRLRLSDLREQAEAALRKSEQKFRSLVEESSEGFTLLDEQGTILEWNRAREKMTGLSAEQVLGRALWDVEYDMLPPEVRTPAHHERARQLIRDALQTGQSPLFDSTLDAEVMTRAGERRFVQQTVFPIKTDLGYRIGSATRDITERKQAEMQLPGQRTTLPRPRREFARLHRSLRPGISAHLRQPGHSAAVQRADGQCDRRNAGQSVTGVCPAGLHRSPAAGNRDRHRKRRGNALPYGSGCYALGPYAVCSRIRSGRPGCVGAGHRARHPRHQGKRTALSDAGRKLSRLCRSVRPRRPVHLRQSCC